MLHNSAKVDRVKLYEFEYIDNQNLRQDDLYRRIGQFLDAESESQAWAPVLRFLEGKPGR